MIVKVHALFSQNDKPGSVLIAKGSKHLEPDMPECSHVSLLVNERWVHEATGSGVNVISLDKWKKIHQEVERIELPSCEYQEIADQFREIKDRDYDYPGVLYLGLCVVATLVGKKLPIVNKWQSWDKYFCCEVLGYMTGQDYSMCCPNQILGKLKRAQLG